jgi:hypothetical protein
VALAVSAWRGFGSGGFRFEARRDNVDWVRKDVYDASNSDSLGSVSRICAAAPRCVELVPMVCAEMYITPPTRTPWGPFFASAQPLRGAPSWCRSGARRCIKRLRLGLPGVRFFAPARTPSSRSRRPLGGRVDRDGVGRLLLTGTESIREGCRSAWSPFGGGVDWRGVGGLLSTGATAAPCVLPCRL